MAGLGLARLGKELKMLTDEPPPGVCAWPVDDCITHLQAQIQGPEDTPYERGTFLLDLQIPERYPFEPPKVRFMTPIYHPNIDSGGRICLDTLKMRPAGSWAPSMNVPTLLTTIRLLMAHPNGDDGLMPDITDLFLKNPSRFADVARAHVEQHARQDASGAAPKGATSGRKSCSPRSSEERKVGDARQTLADSSVEAAPASAVEDKTERPSAGEEAREPAIDAEYTPPSGAAATERPDLRAAGAGATGTEKIADERDASDVAKNGTTTKLQGGEGSGSSKLSRSTTTASSRSSGSEGGAEGVGADASSDDGEWSDSDEDDAEGRPDGKNAKRARTAP